jgi:DNA-binding NarL/FixJ family response regulator
MAFLARQVMIPIRVLLVDDSREFLKAASAFLASDPAIEVVGKFHNAKEALEQAPKLHPDLVLMDIAMPKMNGLEATRRLKQQARPPRVIILTMYDDLEYRNASNLAAADAFMSKSEFGVDLLPLIHSMFPERQPQDIKNTGLKH